MTLERKRTLGEQRAYSALVLQLSETEKWFHDFKLKEKHMPPEWWRIEKDVPVRPRKTRITATFDADVAKFYRALGHGYQARMNAVLRTYMLAVISREIETAANKDWKGDPL